MDAGETRIIDAWIQHPTRGFIAHPMFESLRRWMRITEIPDHISVDLTLAAMDAAGIHTALTCAWGSPSGMMIGNDDVAGFVAESKGRLLGVASVDLRSPMEAVREIRRCKEAGFVGVRILPWLWDLPPDDRRYYPVYVACVETGLPFCLQVGHTGPLMPSDPGRPIPYLDRVALDFPDLVIVGGHIGWPWTEEMIALAVKYPNVYIDTSAYKAKRYPAALVEFMKGAGRKKVLFGSNYPMLMPSAAFDGFDALGLDDDTKRAFLHDNAAKVYKLSV